MTNRAGAFPQIFPLALGCNTFGWTASEEESHRILDAFVDAGGDCLDTADTYSSWAEGNRGGESETILGSWLRRSGRRRDVLLATKVGDHPEFRGLTARNITRACDASLQRLGVERIDVYYAHFDDPGTPLEETVGAFDALVRSGKIGSIGVSNYTPRRLLQWLDIARDTHAVPVVIQPHYNLVHRAEYETGYSPIATTHGLAVVPYLGLAAGFLAGKYRRRADFGTAVRGDTAREYFSDQSLSVLGELDRIALCHNTTVAAVALAWLRSRKLVAAPLASARTVAQLDPLVRSVGLDIGADELLRLDQLSSDL